MQEREISDKDLENQKNTGFRVGRLLIFLAAGFFVMFFGASCASGRGKKPSATGLVVDKPTRIAEKIEYNYDDIPTQTAAASAGGDQDGLREYDETIYRNITDKYVYLLDPSTDQ